MTMTDQAGDAAGGAHLSFLVVEGNCPDLIAGSQAAGMMTAAACYARAIQRSAPGAEIRVVAPCAPDFAPETAPLDGISGAALTGSGVAWSADDARAAPHRRLFERLAAAGVPIIGSCWGLQIAAVVLGGAVRHSPNGVELGVARSIRLTEAGARHPVFTGKEAVFDSVCIHRDEVARPPAGAEVLAGNDHSEIQSFAYEADGVRFVGWQYHPELSLSDVADLLSNPHRPSTDPATRDLIAAFRAADGEPAEGPAPRLNLQAGEDVLCAKRRGREIAAWVDMVRDEAQPTLASAARRTAQSACVSAPSPAQIAPW